MIALPRRTFCLATAVVVIVVGCEREERRLNEKSPPSPTQFVAQVSLQPGPTLVTDTSEGFFDDNAHGTSEGQSLFAQMNCTGCHANGGGSMGPALMDDEWIYGSLPDQIFASIAEGRTNGMPAWKDVLSPAQADAIHAFLIDEQAKTHTRELALQKAGKPLDSRALAIMSNF